MQYNFHPEASPGPNDCIFIFRRFKDLIDCTDGSYPSSLDMNLHASSSEDVTDYSNTGTKTNTSRKNHSLELEDWRDQSSNVSEFESNAGKKKLNNRRKHDTG